MYSVVGSMMPSVRIEIWSCFLEMMVVLSYTESCFWSLSEDEDDDESDIDKSF